MSLTRVEIGPVVCEIDVEARRVAYAVMRGVLRGIGRR